MQPSNTELSAKSTSTADYRYLRDHRTWVNRAWSKYSAAKKKIENKKIGKGKELSYALVVRICQLASASSHNYSVWLTSERVSRGSNLGIERRLPCYKILTNTLSQREKAFREAPQKTLNRGENSEQITLRTLVNYA